jgi:hypothetical protein
MPVTGDQPIGGWLDVVNPSLYREKNGSRPVSSNHPKGRFF